MCLHSVCAYDRIIYLVVSFRIVIIFPFLCTMFVFSIIKYFVTMKEGNNGVKLQKRSQIKANC
jgi:hypothetical protein